MSAIFGKDSLTLKDEKTVPVSALLISVLCLATAGAGNLFWPERLPQVFALLWLLALIPPFLLAYYRGWEGAAVALVVGMVLLIGVEVGGSYLGDRQVRWWILGGVIVVLVTVSLGVGLISDRLHRRESAALELAYSDHLTGLPNRRILDVFLDKAYAAALRGDDLSVTVFDVDAFKRHNDIEGHSTGDEVLRIVAAILSANTRASDICARLGGDEFLTVLRGENVRTALTYAERIRVLVEAVGERRSQPITLSAGIATHDASMSGPNDLIELADRALYQAKALGGNRAVVYTDRGAGEPSGPGRDSVGSPGVRPRSMRQGRRLLGE